MVEPQVGDLCVWDLLWHHNERDEKPQAYVGVYLGARRSTCLYDPNRHSYTYCLMGVDGSYHEVHELDTDGLRVISRFEDAISEK